MVFKDTQSKKFVKHSYRKGVNKDTKAEYEFANVILSDGLESTEYPLDLKALHVADQLQRGDDIIVTIEVTRNGNRTYATVTGIELTA